ncbi:MAG: PAS domain S-box protein [Anaerolineae bacterium]|nr:PAS domain S-box protein [Anaerolineae bacterium]
MNGLAVLRRCSSVAAVVLRRWAGVCLALVLLAFPLAGGAHAAQSVPAHPAMVLILNSYHPGLPFSDGEMEGIRSTLPPDTIYRIEYMDSKRIASDAYRRLLFETYQMKYATQRFDLIFSLDDDALHFLLQYGDALFPDTPVVFCGVNRFEDAMLEGHAQYTGVVETLDNEKTIEVALQLWPKAQRVLVITDNTTTGVFNRQYVQRLAQSGSFDVPLEFLDRGEGLLLSELVEAVRRAPPDSVIYYADFFQDRSGKTLDPGQVMEAVSGAAPVPVFVHGAMYLGHGAVGGKVSGGRYQGEEAARLGLRILQGTPAAQIPVQKDPVTRYTFDARQLKRWNISSSLLPPESVVINRTDTFYQRYALYIWAAAAFILVETILLAGLVFNFLQRRRAVARLARSEERFRQLADLLPQPLFEADLQGRVTFANQQAYRTFGYQPQEVEDGRVSVFDVIAPSERQQVADDLRSLLQEHSKHREYLALRGDGSTFPADVYVSLIHDNGRPIGLRGLVIDISERKEMTERMIQSQKLADLGTLAAGIAHEINTPLQVITASSENLLASLRRGEVQIESLQRRVDHIHTSGWRIAAIVKSLLAYARQSEGQMGRHHLNDLVQNALLLVEHQIRVWSNVQVMFEPGADLPELTCDANKITQVILNLLTNARDAMPHGGSIILRTGFDAERGMLTLTVSDTGEGMSAEVQKRIFDPFYTTKPPGKGTGLGLSIVFGIVRAHGGEIAVQSAPREGSTFVVCLPLQPPPAQETPDDAAEEPLPPRWRET